jgi:hypothetical protein
MSPKVPCQELIGTLLRLAGVELSSTFEKTLRELEGSQLAIEVLKSQGFSVAFVRLGSSLPSCSLMESSNLGVVP